MNKNTIKHFRLSSSDDVAILVLPTKVKVGGYGSFESPALNLDSFR